VMRNSTGRDARRAPARPGNVVSPIMNVDLSPVDSGAGPARADLLAVDGDYGP
jgi:hypothetical protein